MHIKNIAESAVGHFADAEKEIGRACVQPASPDFKYMNGETITLEGGMRHVLNRLIKSIAVMK